MNGPEREGSALNMEVCVISNPTAKGNDKKSGAVAQKLILQKQLFFSGAQILTLPGLFNHFEGFLSSLLLKQSQKKSGETMVVELFIINYESLKDLFVQIEIKKR